MTDSELKSFYKFLKFKNVVRNQGDFAKSINVSRQYIAEAMNGTEKLTDDVVKNVSRRYFDEYQEYLSLPKQSEIERIREQKINGKESKGLLVLPIKVQGGYTRHYLDPVFINDLQRTFIPNNPYDGESFIMAQMEGDSMEYIDPITGQSAGLQAGSWAIYEFIPQEQWRTGLKQFYVHLVVTDTLFTIKRILQDNPDEIVVSPDNEAYMQERIHLRDVRQIAIFKRKLEWNAPPPRKHEIKV